jgi:hypothetical protein
MAQDRVAYTQAELDESLEVSLSLDENQRKLFGVGRYLEKDEAPDSERSEQREVPDEYASGYVATGSEESGGDGRDPVDDEYDDSPARRFSRMTDFWNEKRRNGLSQRYAPVEKCQGEGSEYERTEKRNGFNEETDGYVSTSLEGGGDSRDPVDTESASSVLFLDGLSAYDEYALRKERRDPNGLKYSFGKMRNVDPSSAKASFPQCEASSDDEEGQVQGTEEAEQTEEMKTALTEDDETYNDILSLIDLVQGTEKNKMQESEEYMAGEKEAEQAGEMTTNPLPALNKDDIDHDTLDLIESRRWDKLMARISEYPETASTPLTGASSVWSMGSHGNLVLHEACKNEPPVEVIDAILKVNKEAAKTKGQRDYTPLHYACTSGASIEVIETLMRAHPDAVMSRDCNDLMLPLHMACKSGASEHVIAVLLSKYPEAITVRDIYGKKSMDYAMELYSQETRRTTIECLSVWSRLLEENRTNTTPEDEGELLEEFESSTARENESSFFSMLQHYKNTEEEILFEVEEEFEEDEVAEKYPKVLASEHASNDNGQSVFRRRMISGEEEGGAEAPLGEEAGGAEAPLGEEEGGAEAPLDFELKSKAKSVTQAKTPKSGILDAEHNMLKALHHTQAQQKEFLENRCDTFEIQQSMQEDLIESLRNDVKHAEKELIDALSDQEITYASLLQKERNLVSELEATTEDMERNHALYTQALLDGHETETDKFRKLTIRFQELEQQLRKELDEERAKRKSLEEESNDNEARFQDLEVRLRIELWEEVCKAKGADLEAESTENELQETEGEESEETRSVGSRVKQLEEKVNENSNAVSDRKKAKALQQTLSRKQVLMESLQKKLNSLVEIQAENQETVAAFEQTQATVLQILQDANTLDQAKSRLAALLKGVGVKQMETREHTEEGNTDALVPSQGEEQLEKLQALERNLNEAQLALKVECEKVAVLMQTGTDIREHLETELKKVKDLEQTHEEMEMEVVWERAKAEGLEETRVEIQALLESEQEKVKALEEIRAKSEELLRADQEKMNGFKRSLTEIREGIGEQTEKDVRNEERIKSLELELSQTKSLLFVEQEKSSKLIVSESEECKVKALELTLSQKESLLEMEQQRAQTLEEALTLTTQKHTVIEGLTEKASVFEGVTEHVVRLSCELKKRDFLLAAILENAIPLGFDAHSQPPIEQAQNHLSEQAKKKGHAQLSPIIEEEDAAEKAVVVFNRNSSVVTPGQLCWQMPLFQLGVMVGVPLTMEVHPSNIASNIAVGSSLLQGAMETDVAQWLP